MVSFNTVHLGILVILLSVSSTHTTCTWPEDFDISGRGKLQNKHRVIPKYDEERSWETNLVKRRKDQNINFVKQRQTRITVTDSSTIVVRKIGRHDIIILEDVTYKCTKLFDDNIFMLTLTRNNTRYFEQDVPLKYRCMALKRRSKFVWQWALGSLAEDPLDCSGFSEIFSEWPLVYWPLGENLSPSKVKRHADLLGDYQECPEMGGYNIQAFLSNGTEIKGCGQPGAPLRMEMGCFPGEGLLALPGKPHYNKLCHTLFYDSKAGSRWNCLGSWKDSTYTYTVVNLATVLAPGSPNCLRVNTADPASEPVVLFLDSICKSTSPNPGTESYLSFKLKKSEMKTRCDDTNSECPSGDCTEEAVAAACRSTCDSCPDVRGETIPPEFQGTWVVQDIDKQEVISVYDTSVVLTTLGTFQVYGQGDKMLCGNHRDIVKDHPIYVLGQDSPVSGCTTRVVTFGMRKISPSVAMIFYTRTSPIRNDRHANVTDSWCWNNKLEYHRFGTVLNPYWPAWRRMSRKSGWRNAISSNRTEAVACVLENFMNNVEFKSISFNKGQGVIANCSQSSLRQTGKSRMELSFSGCQGVTAGSVGLTCLGNITLSYKYKMVIVQSDLQISDTQIPLKSRAAYCIIYPTEEWLSKYYNNSLFIHTAGKCDYYLLELLDRLRYSTESPRMDELVKMVYVSGQASQAPSGFILCVFVLIYVSLFM